ncbi:MAG: hypothetical protein QOG26_523, partial [Solirubrobacterales bacterium]|nr:hypothetical protein [Solirubrobacterales bacterium]
DPRASHDPDATAAEAAQRSHGLPFTGFAVLWLVLTGLALTAAGIGARRFLSARHQTLA